MVTTFNPGHRGFSGGFSSFLEESRLGDFGTLDLGLPVSKFSCPTASNVPFRLLFIGVSGLWGWFDVEAGERISSPIGDEKGMRMFPFGARLRLGGVVLSGLGVEPMVSIL